MFEIRISSNYREFAAKVEDFQRWQLPFAAAKALTATAKATARSITTELPSIFDRPTPFTQRGITIRPATKATLTAYVVVKDRQAAYLALEESGGDRQPKGQALVMPAMNKDGSYNAKLNQYGNMPDGYLQMLKSGRTSKAFVGPPMPGTVFVGKVRGVGGFWQRLPGGKVRLIAAFRAAARYKPRFGFKKRVRTIAARHFTVEMQAAFAHALRTARLK